MKLHYLQAGPGMRTPDMAAWRTLTQLKQRQLSLNNNTRSSSPDTEAAPCITVTPPPRDTPPAFTLGGGGDARKLSPLLYDVQL